MIKFPPIKEIAACDAETGAVISLPIGNTHKDLNWQKAIKKENLQLGFVDESGKFLDRFDALLCAVFNNQLNEDGLRLLVKRMYFNDIQCKASKLRECHPGLDSMHLKGYTG